MNLIPWDPWEELHRVRERTDRLWDDFLDKLTDSGTPKVSFMPSADFVETPTEYRLFVSVPGFVEEDIDIMLEGNQLVVRGERQPPYDPDSPARRVCELRYGFFERRFTLFDEIDVDSLAARYDSGMLAIRITKSVAR